MKKIISPVALLLTMFVYIARVDYKGGERARLSEKKSASDIRGLDSVNDNVSSLDSNINKVYSIIIETFPG